MSVSATTASVSSDRDNKPAPETITAKARDSALQALSSTAKTVPQGLVYLDHVCDLVPLAGTASNLVNLGLKHVVFRNVDPNSSYFKAYIEHLNTKDTTTCLALAVPFIGTALKIGSVVSHLYPAPKPPCEDPCDEFLGTSTLGARLLQEEKQQDNAFF